ncbi:type II toxin-antitoxin system HipA family toxin [Sandaracinomonas limnophila]|uniref:Type II toxin-antitoxin system HipA family toxin n=1 Tax=Sandaracinomonas limnophila TaxID=1862386 RepID=A0A437PTI8_9BACT|nr:HipA domain-containing protein [Sandaracinomonas limnophila]RVU25585.1 type II toxin-antitoxin system HipA family toxin [Sandaracinomonas limnophila]
MNRKCLYCYVELLDNHLGDYHPKCSNAFFGSPEAPLLNYSLDEMHKLAKEVVVNQIAVPGVQAKLSLMDETIANEKRKRLTVIGALGGNYIFKPPSEFYPEMPENEHLTMKIASELGIYTVPSSLIRLNSGELAYITKRIDRTIDGQKIHMLDMFQITEAVDKYKSTMERVGKAIGQYSSDTLLDKLKLFELTIFCFLTGNNDMHLKNFSMILSNGKWNMAPAYDLLNVNLANPKDKEELALSLEGKKRKFSIVHFEKFGANLGLNNKQIRGVFKRFETSKSSIQNHINLSFLSKESKDKYWNIVEKKFKAIEA